MNEKMGTADLTIKPPAAAAPEVCIPCQVIRWDYYAIGMLNTASTIAGSNLQAGRKYQDWLKRWYETVEAACEQMKPLLDELTGFEDPAP